MTHYEKQIARNLKFADRIQTLVQTPTLLIFVVDGANHLCPRIR